MELKKLFLLSILTVVTVHPSPPSSTTKSSSSEWIIVDGTKNYSYAMARVLLAQGKHCTLAVRPDDLIHADQRFKPSDNITVLPIDYTKSETRSALCEAGKGKRFLFMDPEHHDYLKWHSTIPAIATNALIAARTNNLTIFYPGRIYPFSNTPTITERSPYQPTTDQGKTLTKVEKMLRHMAEKKLCKVCIVRAPYPFGPGMNDFLLSSSFKDIPRNGQLTWLFRTDHKFQFTYTHDVARLIIELSKKPQSNYFSCFNFAGYTLPSVAALGESIVSVAKQHFTQISIDMHLRQRIVSNLHLNLVSKVEPNALRGKDLASFFLQPAMLDDSTLKAYMPFTSTPLLKAIAETLTWYATNTDTKGLCVV